MSSAWTPGLLPPIVGHILKKKVGEKGKQASTEGCQSSKNKPKSRVSHMINVNQEQFICFTTNSLFLKQIITMHIMSADNSSS